MKYVGILLIGCFVYIIASKLIICFEFCISLVWTNAFSDTVDRHTACLERLSVVKVVVLKLDNCLAVSIITVYD